MIDTNQTLLATGLLALVLLATASTGVGTGAPPKTPGDTSLQKLPRVDTASINHLDYQAPMHRAVLKVWEQPGD